jgi:hypothetical protein
MIEYGLNHKAIFCYSKYSYICKALNYRYYQFMSSVIKFVKIKLGCCFITLLVFFTANSQTPTAQIPPTLTDGVQIETKSPFYNTAFLEMSDMLDGKKPLSIKRAVFLAEWAYYDGKLDYEKYCNTIDSAADFLYRFIAVNKLEEYKTGKNMALIEYFFNPYSGNNYMPFIYNFDSTYETEDWTNQFVCKVMETHKGQCRSLPMYYRILAEAINAEAYIVHAPRHSFIRYRDDDNLFPEDWVNVEVASHQLVPEFWIREQYGMTEKTIKSKAYFHPTTDKETVASQLADLAFGYFRKYRVYSDFTWLCTTKSLEYYPQNINALIIQGKSLEVSWMRYLAENNYIQDRQTEIMKDKLREIYKDLDDLGWEKMSDEFIERIDKNGEEARKRQQQEYENR